MRGGRVLKKCDTGRVLVGSRGILHPADARRHFRHVRHAPHASLSPFVQHYWYIEWDLAEPFHQRVLPHPSVNLTFHRAAHGITGVVRGLHVAELTGRGRVLGVQFRPAGFAPYLGADMSTITGRRLPIDDVFGTAGAALDRAVLDAPDEQAMLRLVDDFLQLVRPDRDPAAEAATAAVALAAADTELTRVDDLAARAGYHPRSLQRLFARYVGVGPKWVIRRYRIHEALERADAGAEVDWARLAADLGYSDQAHFVRDFSTTVGISPGRYRRGFLSGLS